VEATLLVIGLSYRTAPLAMRERFWIGENRRYEVLRQLKSAEGIEEVVVLSTCCRTEFLIWASEPTLAANSLLQFLASQHGLKLSEWQHFYRLLDEAALTHVLRVSSGLDSLVVGETEIAAQVEAAWEQARAIGAVGPFLKGVLEKALSISKKIHSDTPLGAETASVPAAAVQLARQVFGSLEGRKVLLLGTGKISELSARHIKEQGAATVVVIDQSPARAKEAAAGLGGTIAPLTDWWKCMLQADIVVSATGCPHVVLTQLEAERIAEERNRVALVILDLAMPRDVDPEVRRVDGIVLFDREAIEHAMKENAVEPPAAVDDAEKLVKAEAQGLSHRWKAESAVPTGVALRHRLEEICRLELETFIRERGPFTREQNQALHAIAAQVIQKIANSLVHELKELPEKEEQEQMTAVLMRLFHLPAANAGLAGIRAKRKRDERGQIAVH